MPAAHRAAGLGLVEKRRGSRNRIEYRRTAPYSNWIEHVVVVENKSDLDASIARVLADQLEHDVPRALVDEVQAAAKVAGRWAKSALLENLPVGAGILGVDDDSVEMLWCPNLLLPVSEDARRRPVPARCVYDRGWRNYVNTM